MKNYPIRNDSNYSEANHNMKEFYVFKYFVESVPYKNEIPYSKRNHTKRLLTKIYYSPQSKVSISFKLVQNACRN